MSIIYSYSSYTELANLFEIQIKHVKDLNSYYFKLTNNTLHLIHLSELSNIITSNVYCNNINVHSTNKDECSTFINQTSKSAYYLFNKFINNKSLSLNTVKLYTTSIKQLLKKSLLTKSIDKIDFLKVVNEFINKNTSTNYATKNIYIKCLKVWVKWLFKNKYIQSNILKDITFEYKASYVNHRAALNCEYFQSEKDAKGKLSKFLNDVKLNCSTIQYKLWLVHCILGTRRSETIEVINNFKLANNYVLINTKCRKNFSIPITSQVKQLLIELHPYISKFSIKTAEQYLYRCIPAKYKQYMCPHGTRAIFRTVIDLIDSCKATFEVKESYLCHFEGTMCQKSYLRATYFVQRANLQEFWAKWLINLNYD